MSSLDEIPLPPGPRSSSQPTRPHLRPSAPERTSLSERVCQEGRGVANSAGARYAGAAASVPAGLHPRREKMGGAWKRTCRRYHGAPWDWLATAGPRPQPGSRPAPSGEQSGARCEAASQVRARCEPGASLARNPQRPGHRRASPGSRPGRRGEMCFSPRGPAGSPVIHSRAGASPDLDPGPGNVRETSTQGRHLAEAALKRGIGFSRGSPRSQPRQTDLHGRPWLLGALASSSGNE